MKISLELYDKTCRVESERNEYRADELKEIFSRMLVLAGFDPSVIQCEDGGGYECKYIGEES